MKTRFIYLSFFAFLVLSPVWLCSNLAAPQVVHNQQVSKSSPHLNRLSKWIKRYAKISKDTDPEARKRRIERIALWIIGITAALALLYYLQGSILLTLIAVMVGLGINWRKVFPRRYTEYSYKDESSITYIDSQDRRLGSPSNKHTRSSLWQLLVALVSFFLLIPTIFSETAFGPVLLLVSTLVFLILSIVNAFRAVSKKEPLRNWALTPILILVGLITLSGIGGC